MKFEPVFLLVVLAFCLMVFLPIFGKDKTISKRFRSRRRRKVLLGQFAVVILLVATVATLAWPIRGMNSLIQGILMSALVLVPAFVFHLLANLHYRSAFSEAAVTTESGTEAWFSPTADFFSDAKRSKKKANADTPARDQNSDEFSNEPMDFGEEPGSVIHLSSDADLSDQSSSKNDLNNSGLGVKMRQRKPLSNSAALSGIPTHVSGSVGGYEPDVEEQLNRVSEVVESHDLGNQDIIYLHADSDIDVPVIERKPLPKPQFNSMASTEALSSDLESMPRSEITGLVTTLRKDNGRLQKLVIAQHAVIESERESNNRSRGVARDAIKIMRDAQSNLKMAEKIARREKTERQRVQNDYQKVTNVFENAMSIIAESKEESKVNESA